jgi:HAD superfamily hydrolase (TIGR01490 family)
MKIAIFDFDGTITSKDTFLRFVLFTKGKLHFFAGFALHLPLIIAYYAGFYPNWKLKEALFSFFYKGISSEQFDRWGDLFVSEIRKITRPKALAAIDEHLSQGDEVIIVSASIENWVKPWAKAIGCRRVIATQVETDENGFLTGKFSSPNCYGAEKVNRFKAAYPHRDSFVLWAYGDSRGDREMIQYADKGWYNKFKS